MTLLLGGILLYWSASQRQVIFLKIPFIKAFAEVILVIFELFLLPLRHFLQEFTSLS